MGRRRRPAISSYERRRWLETLETGKGVTAISRAAGRDIRVVKRHIEIARQERELGQARRDFIRGRLEQHQDDLLAEVGRLRQAIGRRPAYPLEPDDPLKRKIYEGLKEHARRLPVWGLLGAYQDAAEAHQQARASFQEALQQREGDLLQALPPGTVTYPWSESLSGVLEGHVWYGTHWQRPYEALPQEDGSGYHLRWGEFSLTRSPVGEAALPTIKEAHQKLCSAGEPELPPLRAHAQRLNGLREQLKEELDTFLLKRLVPGRCRYCPA